MTVFYRLLGACMLFALLGECLGCTPGGGVPGVGDMVTIGENTLVCVSHVNNGKMYTSPVVLVADRYSRISLGSSLYGSLFNVQSMGKLTPFSKAYTMGDNASWFPILAVVIGVKQGVVTSVNWDDGCFPGGDNSVCIENAYNNSDPTGIVPAKNIPPVSKGADSAVIDEFCDQNRAYCDLRIFVTWSGTDSNGHAFQSANGRLSLFKGFGLKSLPSTLADFYS